MSNEHIPHVSPYLRFEDYVLYGDTDPPDSGYTAIMVTMAMAVWLWG